MRTILAVAVGNPNNDCVINSTTIPSAVRPYINGLVSWLGNQTAPPDPDPDDQLPKYQIGTDYMIIYREREIANLASAFQDALTLPADLLFCMSTSVARAADAFTKVNAPMKPVVAIVSAPFEETFGANVCGVSASRDRLASQCFRQFKRRINPRGVPPKVKTFYAMYRAGYEPGERAKSWLGNKVTPMPIADTADIKAAIDDKLQNGGPKPGFLILPCDRFFGAANNIVTWTGSRPTFWSAPDFPTGSFGGYGYPQQTCGQFMAECVATIWSNQSNGAPDPMPDPKWEMVDPQYIKPRSNPSLMKSKKSGKSSTKGGKKAKKKK